jgi:hypothetical protein
MKATKIQMTISNKKSSLLDYKIYIQRIDPSTGFSDLDAFLEQESKERQDLIFCENVTSVVFLAIMQQNQKEFLFMIVLSFDFLVWKVNLLN